MPTDKKPSHRPSPLDLLDPDVPVFPASASHLAGLMGQRRSTVEEEAAFIAAEAMRGAKLTTADLPPTSETIH